MPRYEFIEGASSKFWEIELDGVSFTTTYGRIGTDGQSSLKEWPSAEKAQAEHDKLVAEKVKKGYRLVSGAAPAATPVSSAAPAATAAVKAGVFDDEGEVEAPVVKKAPVQQKAPDVPAAGSSKSGEAGARYFELVDGSSSKFWEIQLDGTAFTTRYGKIGTDGQTSMKEWPTAEKAQHEHDKLVAEKTKKGYVEK